MSIVCILQMCCFPTNKDSNMEHRKLEYTHGLQKFFSYIDILNESNIDIILTDNSIDEITMIPEQILKVVPKNVKIHATNQNKYGKINKGAGLIEQWRYLHNEINNYKWIIHFEPRQLLKSFEFIESFIQNPRNIFNHGSTDIPSFNTGIFCLEIKHLLDYIKKDNIDLDQMCSKYISIEYDLYNFIKSNNIIYDTRERMHLIWFPFNGGKNNIPKMYHM